MKRNNKALILIAAFLGSIALNIFVDNCVVDEEFNQMSWEAFCETYHYSYWDMSDEERGVCKDYRRILKNKADKAVRTYLTKGELQRVERCEILTERERLVRARFLIGAYTGMRISDAMEVSTSNVSHGMITYVAKKTGTEATVPCPRKVLDLIAYVKANDCEMSLMTYNKVLRIVCMKSGVNSTVKIHLGGETQEGPKWKFVSSHTARISFATNLANAGVPLIQLAGMMGHTSTQMTERYIANKSVQLSDSAMEYFA